MNAYGSRPAGPAQRSACAQTRCMGANQFETHHGQPGWASRVLWYFRILPLANPARAALRAVSGIVGVGGASAAVSHTPPMGRGVRFSMGKHMDL